jgi:hypothetical protein
VRIHRSRPAERFTIIPDGTLRDPRLSYLARGVLAELLSRPDDWDTSADAMWRRGRHERGEAGEGRKVLRDAFAELEAAGYMNRVRFRADGGRMATQIHVYDDVSAGRTDDQTGSRRSYQGKHESSQVAPTTSPPTVGQPVVGQPVVGALVVSTETYDGNLNTKIDNENGSSLSRAAAAIVAAVPDATEREIRAIVHKIETDPKVRHAGPYIRAAVERGDAAVLVAEARNDLDEADQMSEMFGRPVGAAAAAGPPGSPWCGECQLPGRMRETAEGDPYRCPECNPRAREDEL